MKVRTIDLKLSVEDCKKLKKQLETYKEKLSNFNIEYMKKCLDWVKERSIALLNEDDTFEPSEISDIRDKISIRKDKTTQNKVVLRYYSEIVAWVEFGTGIVGQSDPHPLANQGTTYNYAVGEYSGNEENNFTWRWINPAYDDKTHETQGYVGKQFIYKAVKDFINEKQAIEIYKQEYDKIEETIFGVKRSD